MSNNDEWRGTWNSDNIKEDDDTIAREKKEKKQRKQSQKRKRIELDMEENGQTYENVDPDAYDFNEEQLAQIQKHKMRREMEVEEKIKAQNAIQDSRKKHDLIIKALAIRPYTEFLGNSALDILVRRAFHKKGSIKCNTPIKGCRPFPDRPGMYHAVPLSTEHSLRLGTDIGRYEINTLDMSVQCVSGLPGSKETFYVFNQGEFLRKHTEHGVRGYATIVERMTRGEVFVYSDNNVLMWDHDAALWIDSSKLDLIHLITTTLDSFPSLRNVDDTVQWHKFAFVKGITDMWIHSAGEDDDGKGYKLHDKKSDVVSRLNKIPYLLPIKNRLCVDLRTGEVIQRRQEHLFSIESPINYNGDLNMPTPKADQFFDSIMSKDGKTDRDMSEYMRMILGYCLTGEMRSRAFFIWFGNLGKTGKSTVCLIMAAIMGKFYTQMTKQALVQGAKSTAGAATSHLVPLMYARLVTCSETGVGDKLDENLIKTWTGRDFLAVRQLFREQVNIKTQAKLFLLTNNKPETSGDNATIDRLHFIESTARFQIRSKMKTGDLEADNKLVESLLGTGDDVMDNEGKYITGGPLFTEAFVWILRGSIKWYENLELTGSADIPVPARAKQSTHSFVSESDPVNVWIEAACDTSKDKDLKSELKSAGPVLFNSYVAYCNQNGESISDKKQFYSSLCMKGFNKQPGGERNFIGISPKKL